MATSSFAATDLSSVSIELSLVLATASRASAGHCWNQSMVQQLTREGNCLSLSRKASPTGDMHSTTWRFCFVILTKKSQSS